MTETVTATPSAAPASPPASPPAAPSTPAASTAGSGADARHAAWQNQRDVREAGGQSDPPNNQQQPPGEPKAGAEINELKAFKAARNLRGSQSRRRRTPTVRSCRLTSRCRTACPSLNFALTTRCSHRPSPSRTPRVSPRKASLACWPYAGTQVVSQQQVATARNAEVAKLGATGPARIDALNTYFTSQLGEADGKQFMSRIFTASDVQIAEKLLAKMQGTSRGANFKQGGREPPPVPGRASDEEVARMSPAQRLDYSRSFNQSTLPPWRDPRS
jgi:hypothetical protein